MSKGMAMMIGAVLALLPAAASAQDVGASFRVAERPAQPDLIASAGPGTFGPSARVPGGWAYSVSRGPGGGAGAPRLAGGLQRADVIEVALPASIEAGEPGEPVTWTFVPL